MESKLKSFEDAWQQGLNPRIEDWLTDCQEDKRLNLLQELLGIELWWRKKAGQHPRSEDYLARFHDATHEVQAAFTEFNARSANTYAHEALTEGLARESESPAELSHDDPTNEIGRASCRERVCMLV